MTKTTLKIGDKINTISMKDLHDVYADFSKPGMKQYSLFLEH